MKKKEIKKLKLNLAIFGTIILIMVAAIALMLLIEHLTRVAIAKKNDFIAYKETAGYLYCIIAVFILGLDCCIPYAILDDKLQKKKNKNQKIPSHRKPGKGEGLLKKIKIAFVALNILSILLALPICINSRRELHSDGIYKVKFIGKEKMIYPWNEITGFKIQVEKSRSRTSTTYFPEVVTITDKRNFYFPHYKNQKIKREFFLSLKDNPSVEIDFDQLKKYYSKFSSDNKELVDLLINN